MVRLEKVLYEKVLNTALLGRARTIVKPKHLEHSQEQFLRELPKTRLTQKILNPMWQFIGGIEYRDWRALCLQRGIAFDQILMETDMELFRCPFHEHFMRESTHPYHHTLNKWSRFAYSKVDTYLRGFEAPEYLREPVRQRTYMECKEKIDTFHEMLVKNYENEKTIANHWYRGSMALLELAIFYNSILKMGWNRLFYNEEEYLSTQDWLKNRAYLNSEKKLDLNDKDDRKEFVSQMTAYNKRYPGMIAPDGDEVDFESVFENWNNKNSGKEFSGELTDNDLQSMYGGFNNPGRPFILNEAKGIEESEELTGNNNVGVDLPRYLRNGSGVGLMN